MDLNKYIDHTILKASATKDEVTKICNEAKEYKFASVCVNTCHTALVSKLLEGTGVATCVVVGFPLGAMMSEAKEYEAKLAVAAGANEVDMVINVGALKEKDYAYVEKDIKAVVEFVFTKATTDMILESNIQKYIADHPPIQGRFN